MDDITAQNYDAIIAAQRKDWENDVLRLERENLRLVKENAGFRKRAKRINADLKETRRQWNSAMRQIERMREKCTLLVRAFHHHHAIDADEYLILLDLEKYIGRRNLDFGPQRTHFP